MTGGCLKENIVSKTGCYQEGARCGRSLCVHPIMFFRFQLSWLPLCCQDGWMSGLSSGWMNVWVDGWMEGWRDGGVER